MHCSIWRFEGDADELEQRYLAMLREIPESNHRFHLAAKTDRGLVIVDTCPTEGVYRSFFEDGGPGETLLARHGLVPSAREDHGVLRAYAGGRRVDT